MDVPDPQIAILVVRTLGMCWLGRVCCLIPAEGRGGAGTGVGVVGHPV